MSSAIKTIKEDLEDYIRKQGAVPTGTMAVKLSSLDRATSTMFQTFANADPKFHRLGQRRVTSIYGHTIDCEYATHSFEEFAKNGLQTNEEGSRLIRISLFDWFMGVPMCGGYYKRPIKQLRGVLQNIFSKRDPAEHLKITLAYEIFTENADGVVDDSHYVDLIIYLAQGKDGDANSRWELNKDLPSSL